MKKILFLICVLFGIGINDGFAQTVDVTFNQPIEYNQIPTKHVLGSYTLSVDLEWDGTTFTEDTLNVTLDTGTGAEAFGEHVIDEADWGSPSSFPAIYTEALDTVDATSNATFGIDFGTNNFTFAGSIEIGNVTTTVPIDDLVFSVEETSNTYRRYDGTAGATPAGPNQYGSVGAQYTLQVADFIESITIEFDNADADNTQFNVAVWQLASATASTGTRIFTSTIELVPSTTGGAVTVDLNLDLAAGNYVFMVNQLTGNGFEIVSENTGDDGEVVFFDENDEFDRVEQPDIHTYLTTSSPSTPEFSERVPGDMLIWQVGEASSYTFMATDEDDPDASDIGYRLYDTLPSFNVDWLTFVDNNDGTATISGTPDISNIGTVEIGVRVGDSNDSTDYDTQFGTLNIQVVNSVSFEVPYTEEFGDGTTNDGEIPSNWSISQDIDGNAGLNNPASWREGDGDGFSDQMYINQQTDNRKQNEWLISAPLDIPTSTGSESYVLKFTVEFENGTEDNFVGGNLSTLGSGTDGDGNFADIKVWIQDESDALVEVWNDNDNAEEILDGTTSFTPEIDLSGYAGQSGIKVIFQFQSNNIGTLKSTEVTVDDFIIEENNPFDLTVLARSPYSQIPRSQVDTTGGYDFDYWVINRGQSIPDDAEIVISVTSTNDDNFSEIFTETAISSSDFTNDTIYNTVNIIPAIPDDGSSYTYNFEITVTTSETNSSTQTSSSDQLLIDEDGTDTNFNNPLYTESTFTSSITNDSDQADGLGNVIELYNDDYLAAIQIFFNTTSTAETFQVDIIEVTDADAGSGTVVATIDEDANGDPLNSNDDGVVQIINDPDYDSYLQLSSGTYVIMVTPTSAADTEIDIEISEPNADPLTPDRGDVGDFVRGDADGLYSLDDDAGDIGIAPWFSDYINFDVIAVNDYEQIPRTQTDFTGGHSFEAYIIKRGNSTTDMVVSGTISSTDLDEDIEFENILGTSDFASSDTVILQYDYVPVFFDNDATIDYDFDVDIVQANTPDNNTNTPIGDVNQSITTTFEGGAGATAAWNNSLAQFSSNGTGSSSPEDIADGLGEVFTLDNADYLSALYVDFDGLVNEEITVSIISVTDEDATSGTVVAVIDEKNGNALEADDREVEVEDDDSFSEDIYLAAGTYVVMVNPVESPSWSIDVSDDGNNDKEEFGRFIRGNENNLYYDGDDDPGNLDIRMLFRDNSAPEFFDPTGDDTGVDLTTAVTSVSYLITEGTTETATVIVKDEQANDTFTAELVNTNLSWLTFTTTAGGFELTADGTGAAGDYTAQVRAFDKLDTAFLNVSITIGPNPAPEFTTAPSVIATEGLAYSYVATGSDELGETVTASSELVPSWLTETVNGDSITLTGTPASTDIGAHAVKLLLTDASGNTAEQSFVIIVYANDAPDFTTFPPTDTYVEGNEFYYRAVATDEQGSSALTYNAGTIPTGFTLTDLGGGVAELTSTSVPAGTSSVVLEVTDGITVTQQTFDVVADAANNAPTFTSTPADPDVVTANTTYTYNITASDADGDALQFSAPVMPSWAILINDGNGVARIIGDPNDADAGNHAVTIEVTDGEATASQSYTIQVDASAIDNSDDEEQEAEVVNEDDEVEQSEVASMYPIPAKEILTVKEVQANVTIRIYNQAGRLVKSFETTKEGSTDLDVSDIQPGVYFVQMGDTAEVSRVIIE